MADQQHVVVVGAGPVGFLTALGLVRQGIEVTLIDAGDDIVRSPRAAVYFPITLDFLEELGLIEDCLDTGLRCERMGIHYPEVGEQMLFDYAHGALPEQRYKFNLHFGQHELAAIVRDHLLASGRARILWNHRLVGLRQQTDGVTLEAEAPQGHVLLKAQWVVGADGARSAVRHILGLPFEGFTWPDRFVATNVEADMRAIGFEDTNMVIDPVDWAVIARLGKGNLWRITFGEDSGLDEEAMMARIPARYRRAFIPEGHDFRIDQAAPYRVHERCVPRFRVDRVLLAGDAAHVCNPCGGLGLTTGIMDARALHRLLGAVLNGTASEDVLDFYAADRRRVFLDVTSPTAQHFKRQLCEPDPAVRAMQRDAMRSSMRDPATARMSAVISRQIVGADLPLERERQLLPLA